jgi:hypothetical protein
VADAREKKMSDCEKLKSEKKWLSVVMINSSGLSVFKK